MTHGVEARRERGTAPVLAVESIVCGHCRLGEHAECLGTGLPTKFWVCVCDSSEHLILEGSGGESEDR